MNTTQNINDKAYVKCNLDIHIPDGKFCNCRVDIDNKIRNISCIFLSGFEPMGMMVEWNCRLLGVQKLENVNIQDYRGWTGNKIKHLECPSLNNLTR